MSWKRLSALAAALALTGAFAGQALAQRDEDEDRSRWVLLGQRTVNMATETDRIRIPQEKWTERGFRRLHMVAEGGSIHLKKVRLVYKDGPYDITVNRTIREGQEEEIKLRGDKKFVEEVVLLYRSSEGFDRTVLKLYGVPPRRPAGPDVEMPGKDEAAGPKGNWVDLGCRQVAMDRTDRDAIRVGRRDGSFRAIRLLGRGADIEIDDLWVVYGNGESDRLPVRRVLRQGDATRALDLQGRRRVIDRIELTYRRIPGRGVATVCAEGLE